MNDRWLAITQEAVNRWHEAGADADDVRGILLGAAVGSFAAAGFDLEEFRRAVDYVWAQYSMAMRAGSKGQSS